MGTVESAQNGEEIRFEKLQDKSDNSQEAGPARRALKVVIRHSVAASGEYICMHVCRAALALLTTNIWPIETFSQHLPEYANCRDRCSPAPRRLAQQMPCVVSVLVVSMLNALCAP